MNIQLTALEARVIGSLIEKAITTPDQLQTDIVFDISGAQIGDVVTSRFTAMMTDADGLSAQATAAVEILIIHHRPPPPPPPPPPLEVLDE